MQWHPAGGAQHYLSEPGSPLTSEPLCASMPVAAHQAQMPYGGAQGHLADPLLAQHGQLSPFDGVSASTIAISRMLHAISNLL